MITPDQLQNELIVIAHHVEDAMKGLKEGDTSYVNKALIDINEAIARLKNFIPNGSSEVDRIAGELE